jgi:hypothetical protein
MMTVKRSHLIGATLAVLVALVVASRAWKSPSIEESAATSQTAGASTFANVASAPSEVTSISAPKQQVATPRPERAASSREQLQRDFFDAADWRAFALAARAKPEAGGYFYAMLAANLCGRDTHVFERMGEDVTKGLVSSTSTVSSTRLEVLHRFNARCASFADGEANNLYKEVDVLSGDDKDPLVSARKAYSIVASSNDGAGIERTARAIFATGDFALISAQGVLQRLAYRDGGYPWFDGEKYDTLERQSTLTQALLLGSCRDGAYCELDDQIMIACVSRNVCPSQREEFLRMEYYPDAGSSSAYQEMIALSSRVRSRILEGNVTAFLAKKP